MKCLKIYPFARGGVGIRWVKTSESGLLSLEASHPWCIGPLAGANTFLHVPSIRSGHFRFQNRMMIRNFAPSRILRFVLHVVLSSFRETRTVSYR